MTRADHPSGTDRVAEVVENMKGCEIIVNLQGDEPEVRGDSLDLVVSLLENDPEAPMATLATPIHDPKVFHDPSCVKVVISRSGRALYFSARRSRSLAKARGRAIRSASCISAFMPIAAISCSSSRLCLLRRWNALKSSNSFACSNTDSRSPSAWSTNRRSASTLPRTIAGSSREFVANKPRRRANKK